MVQLGAARVSSFYIFRQDFFDADIHTRNFNVGHLSIHRSPLRNSTQTSTRQLSQTRESLKFRERHIPKMATSSNTLLIEGSFTELVDELAQYVDALRKATGVEGSIRADIGPALDKLREKEQSEEEPSEAQQDQVLTERDEIMKKVVVACQALNGAPEKGGIYSFALGTCGLRGILFSEGVLAFEGPLELCYGLC